MGVEVGWLVVRHEVGWSISRSIRRSVRPSVFMLGLGLRLGVCKSEHKNHGEMEFNMISTSNDFGLGLDFGVDSRLGFMV